MDFADLTYGFFEAARIETAKKGRYKAIGRFGGITIPVIFKPLEPKPFLSFRCGKQARSKGACYDRQLQEGVGSDCSEADCC